MIRSLAASGVITGHAVEWENFGRAADIWLDACVKRADDFPNAAITNVRFKNEFDRLKAEGWQHWHVMCSGDTWAARLSVRGLTPESVVVADISEQLAASLDASVTKKLVQRVGPKLHVIWSDGNVPAPSPRFYTVAEFLTEVNS